MVADERTLALLLGTCGWSYQEWVGMFYPNNRIAKLSFYNRVFETVEVDSSFYRAPSKQMVSGWAKAVAPSFKFSLKVPKSITHDKRLTGIEQDFASFLEVLEPLVKTERLGCLLVQLPPNFVFGQDEIERLERLFEFFPSTMHFAVEFRHESWDRQETWTLLKKYNVANTITDSPLEFLSKPVVTSSTHAFIRWHGRGEKIWYDYRYSEQELLKWVEKLRLIETKVGTVYGYFNNHYRAGAPTNALQFLEMAGRITEPQKKAKERIERKFWSEKPVRITDFMNR